MRHTLLSLNAPLLKLNDLMRIITQQVQKLYTEVSLGTSKWCRKTAQEALPLPCASSSCCVSRRSSRCP